MPESEDVGEGLSPQEERCLWQELRENNSMVAREALAQRYMPLARIVAADLYARRHILELEFCDYLQYASIGMLEAMERYNPDANASFKTYASYRIQGCILSGVEKLSEKQQQIAFRKRLNQQRLQSLASGNQKGRNCDSPFFELAEVAIGLAMGYLLEGSGMYRAEENDGYLAENYKSHEIGQLQQLLHKIVSLLPEREKSVIKYHYYQQLSFEEISEMLGVTKGRVSQLHRGALNLLKQIYEKLEGLDTTL